MSEEEWLLPKQTRRRTRRVTQSILGSSLGGRKPQLWVLTEYRKVWTSIDL